MKTFNVGEIRVGRSRFSISGGIGIGFIEQRTFGRQPAPGDDGAVQTVFAVTEEDSESWGAVTQLNARLGKERKNGSWHWSLGIGTKSGDSDAVFTFYTGPSFSFIDDHLFFTFGYYQEKVKELAGFEIGDAIPMEVMDPLPVREETKGGLLLTITYKVR